MNPLQVCLLLVWAAEPMAVPSTPIYEFSPRLQAAIRGQSPSPYPGPVLEAPVPASPDLYNPFEPPALGDQQLYQPGPTPYGLPAPYGAPAPIFSGVNGPQMYRFGYIPKMEIGYIPQSDLEGRNSSVEMFEIDSELRYNSPFADGWILSTAGQFDYRAWNTDSTLSSLYRINLYRFGLDMELAKMKANGWSLAFDFNPSINTDFEHNLTSDAWNFDTRIVGTYQVDPTLMVVLGVQYWDRVDDIIIPYAGVVYTPNDLWEFRLLFPKARISRFLGNFWGGHHWLYVSSEYNVEAYQIDLTSVGSSARNRIQYEDWRLALGLRSDHVWFDKFIEVAWDLGRNFEFEQDIQKIDIGNQVLIRGGIRF